MRAALLVALLACAGASFWVAEGVAPWAADTHNAWHHYEYLAEGFARGHTYLSLDPPPELLALADPYDPASNAPSRLWDASLYKGRYYLYYGPAPAVALMVPWRLATGRTMPQRVAVAAFASIGSLALALLIRGVARRHFPGLSGAAQAAILVVSFHAAWLPVILRRPSFWELPIVSAAACLWWALYFLWRFHDSGGRARWAAATGLALALLMGSRATFVFASGVLVLLALVPAQGAARGPLGFRRWGILAGAVAFAGGVLLLVYNHERFGRWLEFGQSYQLWGADERHVAHMSLGYVPFNVWTYLFSLPSAGPYFPFLHPYWADAFPPGYIAFEEVYGVLFMMPVHLVGLAAVAWAWRSRGSPAAAPLRIVLAGSAAASVLGFLTLVCWAGACSRYLTELSAGWTVVTAVGLMAVSSGGGKALRSLALAAALWTIGCVWLASADFRGFMRLTNPGVYAGIARVLNAPSDWWARAHGIHFGPVDLLLSVPPSPAGTQTVLIASGRPQRANQLVLESLGGGRFRLALDDNQRPVLETPPLEATGGRIRVTLAAPWLYPPPEHPYWDRIPDARQRDLLQHRFAIAWPAGSVSTLSPLSSDPTAFAPAVRSPSPDAPGSASVERMEPASRP